MNSTSLKTRMLEAFRKRMYVFFISVSSIFAILVLQLINLQLIQGKEYTLKATMNMENNIPIPGVKYMTGISRGVLPEQFLFQTGHPLTLLWFPRISSQKRR